MDNHLDWMETLGEAFLAQPGDVMNAVQRLRASAQSAGNLPSNGEETVSDQNGTVAISPPSDLVYVPQYDPWCAFGDWPYPVAPPFYFSSWSGTCEPADFGVVFAPGIGWPFSFWDWGYFDWNSHRVLVHPDKYRQFHPGQPLRSSVWEHNPQHRDGLLYRNPHNIRTFGQIVARQNQAQVRASQPAGSVRSMAPLQSGSPGRALRIPMRSTMMATGSDRPGFGQYAHRGRSVGKGRAALSPDHH
jgi:hypothetical protein